MRCADAGVLRLDPGAGVVYYFSCINENEGRKGPQRLHDAPVWELNGVGDLGSGGWCAARVRLFPGAGVSSQTRDNHVDKTKPLYEGSGVISGK